MITLGDASITVDGVSVFADHADPRQFWYLPGPVRLSRDEDGAPNLTLMRYRDTSSDDAGGLLTLDVNLTLAPDTERAILQRLRAQSPGGEPRLAAVPFDTGKVECLILDAQGPGGTIVERSEGGRAPMVERILGAKTPSLFGDNAAIFSVGLSRDGVEIVRQAIEQGASPVGVIYRLAFSAIRPNLHVKVTADYERIYTHFSGGVEGNVYMVQGGIDAGFEELVEERAIRVEAVDFTGEADRAEKEEQALEFFKTQLMHELFEPTLDLGTLQEPDTRLGDLSEAAAQAATAVASAAKEGAEDAKPVRIAFKLRFIRQEERRTATFSYDRADAVTRVYAPQAFVGLLARDLEEPERHIVDVALRRFTVRTQPPALDFERYGLRSVHVALRYRDPERPGFDQVGDALFESADDPSVEREFDLNSSSELACDYTAQYDFVAGGEWDGEHFRYSLPERRTSELSISPNPFDDVGFLVITVQPFQIDGELIASTVVHLRYEAETGWSRSRQFVVAPDSAPQAWRLRLSDPDDRRFSFRFEHHLTDGSRRTTEEVETTTPTVLVVDPFDQVLELEAEPLFDPEAFRLVLVDVLYEDSANGYRREVSFRFDTTADGPPAPTSARIPLLDPERRDYSLRVSWVTHDGDVIREEPRVTDARRIELLGPAPARGGP